MTADARRRLVRRTAVDLQPGDRCQPWNDRAAPRRTVKVVKLGNYPGDIIVFWTDGRADAVTERTVFHTLPD